jgi:hypothetical protein
MECEGADGSVSLFWLPAKFSKNVWAQRGDYLIVEPDSSAGEAGRDSKVTGTIVQILFPEQVAHLRTLPCWPEGFPKDSRKPEGDAAATREAADAVGGVGSGAGSGAGAGAGAGARAGAGAGAEAGAEAGAGAGAGAGAADDESESEDDDDDLFVNNNRNHDDLIDSDQD